MTKKLFNCASWIGLMLYAVTTPAHANTYERTLSNGLQIIVKEDSRAPTVVHMVWYRVGSMDELNGNTGVAHVLEHMMFKGTPQVGLGKFSQRVAAAGGRDNAFTSRDYTAYFQQVPKEKLEEMMVLEADRMRHLNLAANDFSQEIKVVMEERRLRTDDQPQALLMESVNATAFQSHPYRHPIIGWMNDLENMRVQDARDWYERWYVPNNAYVVVVGDVDYRSVFRAAEKHYGALKARALPTRKPQEEAPQAGLRRVTVKAPAKLPMLIMAYKVPVIRSLEKESDAYALDILAAILSGHSAARFSTHLVREQGLALSANVNYDSTARGPGLFYLIATPSEGKTTAALEIGLRNEIVRIQKEGIRPEELDRAKAQLIAGQIYQLDSMFAQAMEIGQLNAIGLPSASGQTILETLQNVNATMIQSVAQRYFGDDQLTIGVLEPQPLPETSPPPSAPVKH